MQNLTFEVKMELDGWDLFWAHLTVGEDQSGLADLRTRVTGGVRERFPEPAAIAAHPPVVAMRKLFRAAGCDPTRYRPASEALLRRLVKGAELPPIHPLVDVNNCLSAELAVPCCVMKEGSLGTSLVFRPGAAGESYESLRGPFNAEAKPLLVDEIGPIDTPITGSERVKVQKDTEKAWLVAYLPRVVVSAADGWAALEVIARAAGVTVERFQSS
ncbi:MAG: phenylalanine--tRNA ligase beta subunit-related protein [Acidobacteriota bacterium]|jgi:DNA/RNA-binding domain of Phe-tRNA-synthetase-like protein|nr:phenylalanine--tRNA ligase beta subunit-related protein [Acidobacteriota bacterium]